MPVSKFDSQLFWCSHLILELLDTASVNIHRTYSLHRV